MAGWISNPLVFAGGPEFPTTKVPFDGAYLPDGVVAGDRFGEAIAMSDDYIVFGAPGGDVESVSNAGRAYVYDAHTNQLIYELQSPAPGASDEFGAALTIDGDLIAVGARNDDQFITDGGAVFLFDAATGALVDTLFPESPGEFDRFGFSIAMNDSYICVGLANDNEAGTNVGSVEVFDRNTRVRLGKLLPEDPSDIRGFGARSAISGQTLAISASSSNLGGTDRGAVFAFDLSTMTQQYFVQGSDTMGRDEFGSTIAVTADRLFVGTELNDAHGDRSGSVYGFDLGSGQELFKLEIQDPMPNDRFGSALAADDEYVVVGAKRSAIDEANGGAVYLFRASDGRLLSRLVTDQIGLGDQIGTGAAIYNGRVLTSGLRQPSSGITSGYVYSLSLGSRVFEDEMLLPCSYPPYDEYGRTIAIDGDTLVIGAQLDDSCGVNSNFGSGTVYVYDIRSGKQLFQLSGLVQESYTRFGVDLEITDQYIVVASNRGRLNSRNGAVYVFDRFSGSLIRTIQPEQENGFDYFGSSIDIDQGLLAVGAPWYSVDHNEEGAAYVFDLKSGQQLSICVADDRDTGDNLGTDVSIHNGIVAAGAPDASGIVNREGAVYLFDAFTGEQVTKINAGKNWTQGGGFGESIIQSDDYLIIGAPSQNTAGIGAGSVFVFDANTLMLIEEITSPWAEFSDHFGNSLARWDDQLLIGMERRVFSDGGRPPNALIYDLSTFEVVHELVPSRGSELAGFGSGVAMNNRYALVGMSPERNVPFAGHTAAAFVYQIVEANPCPADLNTDGLLDFFDVSAFLVAFASDDLTVADLNDDGSLDFFDVSAFLVAFKAGCP